jgi:N-methylhydantoinase A
MEGEATEALIKDFGTSDVYYEHKAEMRFRGQRHNIQVPITGLRSVAEIRNAFERDYRRRYGHADSEAPTELQALHLSAFARLRRPDIKALSRETGEGREQQQRPVYFGGAGGMQDTEIYDRHGLDVGFKAVGPAVIEEYGSTTIEWPGDKFEIGQMGEIIISCGES